MGIRNINDFKITERKLCCTTSKYFPLVFCNSDMQFLNPCIKEEALRSVEYALCSFKAFIYIDSFVLPSSFRKFTKFS